MLAYLLGALKTQVAKMILGEEFLEKLVPEARQKWTQLYGQTVAEYNISAAIYHRESWETSL